MTAHALALVGLGMLDLLAVTRRAGARVRPIVLVVAADAGVFRRRDHLRVLVTVCARPRLELVRLVAARAIDVTRGERAIVDVQLARLLRVTPLAADIGHVLRIDRGERRAAVLVHRVTVEAAVKARVLRLALVVAARARARRRRRRGVWLVTLAAILVGVRADGLRVAAIAVVTAHAAPRRFVAREAVAVDACGCGLARGRVRRMQWRRLRVTARAQIGGGLAERVVVARVALELAEVGLVSRARAHLAVLRGHEAREDRRVATVARDERHDDEQEALHRTPIG